MKNVIILSVLLFSNTVFSQKWILKKETENTKAYIKQSDEEAKSYKIVSYFNTDIQCLSKTILDFKNYKTAMKDLKELKVLSVKENEIIAYWRFAMPWPFSDRDVITKTVLTKTPKKIVIKTFSIKYKNIPPKPDIVRINEYSEQYSITKISENKSKIILIGKINPAGNIPAWLQKMFLIDSPLDFLEYVRKKC